MDVLTGAQDERITRFGHDQISTYGIGTEHDNRTWRAILRQLIALRLVTVDLSGHGGLSISAEGRQFLRERPQLQLRAPAPKAAGRRRAGDSRSGPAPVPQADQALFDALRAKRMELAKAQGVPPYVIFHDRTLAELAAARPKTARAMASIPGIGETKLERYGPAFLEILIAQGRPND